MHTLAIDGQAGDDRQLALYITQAILFLSLTAAVLLAFFAPFWVKTEAGAWTLGILGILFVLTLLVLTGIASFADDLEGNTFSEMLRASTVNATSIPGRWPSTWGAGSTPWPSSSRRWALRAAQQSSWQAPG